MPDVNSFFNSSGSAPAQPNPKDLNVSELKLKRDPESPNGHETGPDIDTLAGSISYSDKNSGSANWKD
jgi:hypothetical protein